MKRHLRLLTLLLFLLPAGALLAQSAPAAPATTSEKQDFEFEEGIPPKFDLGQLHRDAGYPEEARRNGIEETIIVSVLLDTDGKVMRTRIDSGENQLLIDAALEAIHKTRFTPGTQNGVAVRCRILIPVRFSLDDW